MITFVAGFLIPGTGQQSTRNIYLSDCYASGIITGKYYFHVKGMIIYCYDVYLFYALNYSMLSDYHVFNVTYLSPLIGIYLSLHSEFFSLSYSSREPAGIAFRPCGSLRVIKKLKLFDNRYLTSACL